MSKGHFNDKKTKIKISPKGQNLLLILKKFNKR